MKSPRILILGFLLMFPLLAQAEDLQEITIGSGDTLWSIANKYLKDPHKWPEIVRVNNLQTADPTIAIPGKRLKIPVTLIKEEYRNALLIDLIPDVRVKPKAGGDWKPAQKSMMLNYEDNLRTMAGAQARVQFPSKEVVQINENSFVVLKPEKIMQEVELLQGNVRASRAKVIMPQGTVVQPRGGRSDYQAKVREDSTEVVFVYKGKVDVTAKGKTVTVPEGFGTEVPKASEPKEPLPLTSFKDFNPAEMTINSPVIPIDVNKGVVSVSAPQQKTTEDTGSKSKSLVSKDMMSTYRMQLASDEKFTKVLVDRTEATGTSFDLRKQGIPDGTYYMRIAFIDAMGSMGPYSQPTQVDKDTVAPKILNLVPNEGQKFFGEEAYCDIIGTVQDAALLAVNDEILFVSPVGRFSKFITLKEGENIIKVTARDASGNETEIIRRVYYSEHGR